MCISTMYGGTAAYWALTLRSYTFHVLSTANGAITGGNDIVAGGNSSVSPASPEGTPSHPWVFGVSSDLAMRSEDLQMCSGTAALLINVCC